METADALRAPVLVDKSAVEVAQAAPAPVPPANAAGCPMSYSSGSLSPGWVAKRRGWIVAGAAAVAGTGVALGEGWVTVAGLTPILYTLPCAVMMLFCMRGMSRGMQAQDQTQNQAAALPAAAVADAPRPIPELEKQA